MASTFRRKAKKGNKNNEQSPAPLAGSDSSKENHAGVFDSMKLSGTKPWTGGITLTSVGVKELDSILGGGQPLGTCILLEEDRWTKSLASCIMRYWCAEAISNDQILWIPTSNVSKDSIKTCDFHFKEDNDLYVPSSSGNGYLSKQEAKEIVQSLPRNLHWEKHKQKQVKQEQEKRSQEGGSGTSSENAQPNLNLGLQTLQEEDEGREDYTGAVAEDDEGLKIAWQYRKDVQRQRLGEHGSSPMSSSSSSLDVYCHSYDLSGKLMDQIADQRSDENTRREASSTLTDALNFNLHNPGCGYQLYQQLFRHIQKLVAANENSNDGRPRRKVIRLLLYHPVMETLSVALPLLLVQIRQHEWPVVILVSLQSWIRSSSRTVSTRSLWSLRRTSDVVLQVEGFSSRSQYPPPFEFRHLHGLLQIPKVNTVTASTAAGHFANVTTSKRPIANMWGLKRDRRKLHIELLHIPPEDYTEGGAGSVSGGGVRSGGGMTTTKQAQKSSASGCAPGGVSPIDF